MVVWRLEQRNGRREAEQVREGQQPRAHRQHDTAGHGAGVHHILRSDRAPHRARHLSDVCDQSPHGVLADDDLQAEALADGRFGRGGVAGGNRIHAQDGHRLLRVHCRHVRGALLRRQYYRQSDIRDPVDSRRVHDVGPRQRSPAGPEAGDEDAGSTASGHQAETVRARAHAGPRGRLREHGVPRAWCGGGVRRGEPEEGAGRPVERDHHLGRRRGGVTAAGRRISSAARRPDPLAS
mmetsp:Transcript_7108/g.19149  ORF Transcript_7108/g.19149 Transcript_7108/m.19149 type:complete len:237 (+) Transcript_7108:958-1668(+)